MDDFAIHLKKVNLLIKNFIKIWGNVGSNLIEILYISIFHLVFFLQIKLFFPFLDQSQNHPKTEKNPWKENFYQFYIKKAAREKSTQKFHQNQSILVDRKIRVNFQAQKNPPKKEISKNFHFKNFFFYFLNIRLFFNLTVCSSLALFLQIFQIKKIK